ncbi:MAG: hypothetical protein KC620_23690, partial [Myxococcales bacterium]|nr:hypothetical protein [Myxococcales bacterium]
GQPPDRPATPEREAEAAALTGVEGRLVARYEAPMARIRRVALDVIEGHRLVEALLDEAPEAAIRQAWLDAGTRARVDVVRVPRVPTATEIDDAIASRSAELAEAYARNQRLFNRPARVLARRLLVAVPAGADEAAWAAARTRIETLRGQAVGGADFEALIASQPGGGGRGGGQVTLTRERAPALFDLAVGAYGPIERLRQGWAFHRVDGHAAAVERTLDDPRVQRELAASLLREKDQLPAARATAERVRALLAQAPEGDALKALVAKAHLQRAQTDWFGRAGPPMVPEVGLAPALFDAVFALTEKAPVSSVFVVRQDYVVARLLALEAPSPEGWAAARQAFTARWRAQQRSAVLDAWIKHQLEGQAHWIDGRQLSALPAEALRPPREGESGPQRQVER